MYTPTSNSVSGHFTSLRTQQPSHTMLNYYLARKVQYDDPNEITSGRWDTSRIGVLTSRVLETSYHGDKDPTRPLKPGLRSEVITVSVRRPRDDGTHLCGRVPPIAQEEPESPHSPASDRSLGAVMGQSFPIPLVIIRRVIYSTNPGKDSVLSNANA
jgi:hypothetical protein